MSGVIVLVVLGLWAGFGWWLWKGFVRSRLASPLVRGAAFLALAGAWFVLPVADEILGARAFERLCAEIPETKFHGPIAVGPGAFFDENGNRKWKNGDEFARIQIGTSDWNRLWESRTEETRIARWPMIVFPGAQPPHRKSDGKNCQRVLRSGVGRRLAATPYRTRHARRVPVPFVGIRSEG